MDGMPMGGFPDDGPMGAGGPPGGPGGPGGPGPGFPPPEPLERNEECIKRQDLILKTMNGEHTERTPMMWAGDVALFRYVKPELTFKDILDGYGECMDLLIDEVLPKFPKLDMLEACGMSPRNLGAPFLVQTMLPGRDLPDDVMWTLKFDHSFTEDVYKTIIETGWGPFFASQVFGRLGYDPASMGMELGNSKKYAAMLRNAGMPFKVGGGPMAAPFDTLAFGRGQENFYMDMYEYEDEIVECMTVMMESDLAMMKDSVIAEVAQAAEVGERVMYCVIPCVNANCDMLSREQFETFGWPLIEREVNFLIDLGCVVRLHMDCNWTKFLDYFTDFPKGQIIFDTDGSTDLEKCRDILGPVMAFTGTVPPAVLAMGTPDEVYNTVREQIETLGDSFIASPSCTIPANAPKENIDAMYAAAAE